MCECDETCGVAQAHALVTFHKWGLPGQFPGCLWPFFGRPALDPEGPRPGAVHFFTPGGSRVTFNSNGPRREIYHVYQACKQSGRGSAGPLSGFARETGTIFEGQHAGYLHAPPPPWLVGDPGGVPPVPSGCRYPCMISRGIHSYRETHLSMFNLSIHQ